jgi:hypothetical protein
MSGLMTPGLYWVDRGNGPEIGRLARLEAGSVINGMPASEEVMDLWSYIGRPYAVDQPPEKIIGRVCPAPLPVAKAPQ